MPADAATACPEYVVGSYYGGRTVIDVTRYGKAGDAMSRYAVNGQAVIHTYTDGTSGARSRRSRRCCDRGRSSVHLHDEGRLGWLRVAGRVHDGAGASDPVNTSTPGCEVGE